MRTKRFLVAPAVVAVVTALGALIPMPAIAQDCAPSAEPVVLVCDEATLSCSLTVRACFDPPTQRKDGTALPMDEIAGYQMQLTTSGGEQTVDYFGPGQDVSASMGITKADVLDDRATSIAVAIRTVDVYGNVADTWSPTVLAAAQFSNAFYEAVGASLSTPGQVLDVDVKLITQ